MAQVDTTLDDSANRTGFDVGAIADLNAKVFGLGGSDPLTAVIDHNLDRVPVAIIPSKKEGLGDYYISSVDSTTFTVVRSVAFPIEFLVF